MKALLDDNTMAPWHGTEPGTVIPGELEVRTALPDELQRFATSLNGNLAVLRCALIALKARHASHLSWPTIFELSGLKPAVPYNLVCNNTLK